MMQLLWPKWPQKKTAGILGDDLAVGAEKASGYPASREFPVLWAITKGSFLNKLMILPAAFLLSAFLPWIIVPILTDFSRLIDIAENKWKALKFSGELLVKALPLVIKLLSIVGTIAMLLVAGGIYVHNLQWLHEWLHFLPMLLSELLVGMILGIIVLSMEKLFFKIKNRLVTKH